MRFNTERSCVAFFMSFLFASSASTVCAQIPFITEYYCTKVCNEKNKETSIIPLKLVLRKTISQMKSLLVNIFESK